MPTKLIAGKTDLATLRPDLAKEWHPTRNRIAPDQVAGWSHSKVWWKCEKYGHEWQASVASRNTGCGCPVCRGQRVIAGSNDLGTLHPAVAAEWHLRNDFEPTSVRPGSNKKVWWRCALDHEWQATIYSRSTLGTGCPYCSNKAVLPGFNDLAATRPDLAAEWHPTYNGTTSPESVHQGSPRRIWWKCKHHGHEWRSELRNRIRQNDGCPYCSGKRVLVGFNDLATRRPDLASQWSSENGLCATSVTVSSNKRVAWKCQFGHEWRTSVTNRTSNGTGCPVCTGRQTLPGFNDLETTHPTLAAEWDPIKNSISPRDVSAGSHRAVWWRCTGHSWKQPVQQRTRGHGCSVCAGRTVIAGTNDLVSQSPAIANEWHPELNSSAPEQILSTGGYRAWWLCPIGHEYKTTVYSRSVDGTGCPFCAGNAVMPGFNDIATTRPDLAAEWHPTRNEGTSPESVSAGSSRKIWWKCGANHAWIATAASRASGSGCSRCRQSGTSQREQAICTTIAQHFEFHDYDGPTRVDGWVREVDLALPDIRIVIEFDGWYWHRNKLEVDTRKTHALEAHGWTVIRIRESSGGRPLPAIACTQVSCTDREPAQTVAERTIAIINVLRA